MSQARLRRHAFGIALSGIACLAAACSNAGPSSVPGNAPYAGVVMSYPHSGCSYTSSPVDFCHPHAGAQLQDALHPGPA